MSDSNDKTYDIFSDADLIYGYSRAEMIQDGFLIEVPEKLWREAGFKFPIGILVEIWQDCVVWKTKAGRSV